MITFGIIGNGFVGKAMKELKCKKNKAIVYDINSELCEPKGTIINDLCKCDIIFICVPTPMNKDGSCHINIVESIIKSIKFIQGRTDNIIIKSTVPVGTCDKLNTNFSPEFLTEKNYINDFINCEHWIFGINKSYDNIKYKITNLINNAYEEGKITHNNIHFVSNSEAEMIKYFRNAFLATKISYCNEIAEFCESKDIEYENVRKLATLDKRITDSHTYVPGHDGKNGYGGTCLPKDCNSLKKQMENVNMTSYILDSVLKRNYMVDRTNKDWENNVGRAII